MNNQFNLDTTDIATALTDGYPFQDLDQIKQFFVELEASTIIKDHNQIALQKTAKCV